MKMRLLYFKLLFLLFYNIQTFAQNVLLKNAVKIEGTKTITTRSIQVDSQNNKYVAGTFNGTADFDSSENEALLTTNGGNDIFLAKYDENGNYLWAFNLGGASTSGFYFDAMGDMILDNQGNIYLTGDITGTTDMDPSGNTANMSAGIFLAKYNSNGGYLWAFSIYGSSTSQAGKSLAVDSSNNVYMAGVFANSNGDFDPSSNEKKLQAIGSNDYFIAKYTEDGNYLWAFNLGSTTNQSYGDINILTDNSSNLFVSGNFSGIMDFDPSKEVESYDAGGDLNMFLAKYNSNGNYIWAKDIKTIDNTNDGVISNIAYGMDIDSSNNVYISGQMGLPIDFDPTENNAIFDISSSKKQSFLSKYDEDGDYEWAVAFANTNNSLSTGLVIDSQSSNIYVTGFSNHSADFDPTNQEDILTSSSSYQNLYLAKYDSNGVYEWAKTVGADDANDKSYANTIAINNDDSQISLAGYFNGSIDFNAPGQEKIETNSNNYSNGFIATYNFTEPSTISIPDANFEQALIDLGYDTNGLDGGMSQSDAEAIVSLNISNPTGNSNLPNVNSKITNITGIETFINLESLNCSYNNLTELDVSTNTKLTWLNVSNNQLSNINVTNNIALQTFACYDNEIEYLYLGQLVNLLNFSAQRNNLKYLNIKNGGNKLMSDFYVKENPNLTCIQVDDETWSSTYWGSTKDNIASFSNECSAIDLPINAEGMWNDPSNWASGVVPTSADNVVIPSGITLQISDDISEINSLENEGTIVINPTFSLKSKTDMVNTGTILMDSDNGDSSVLFIEGTSTGEVVYKRGGLKANKWSLVTPPVSGQKITEFATNTDNDIRTNETVSPIRYAVGYYDDSQEEDKEWVYYDTTTDENLTFTAGQSYAISRATDGAVSFTGTLTTNNLTRTLQPGEWNAIGNPFTTYYPANKNSSSSFLNDNYAILDDNFKGLYVWDNAQNKYVVVSEMDLQDRSFTPGQGFFIKVKPDATKIEFKEAKRSIKPATGTTVFNKTVNKYIRLLANDGTYTVSTDIKFLNNATNGFDIGLDIGNFSSSSFDFYTHLVDNSNTKNYTIQSIPFENQHEYIIPLGITAKDSDVVLSSLHNNLPVNSTLVIEDRKNNTFTDITDENSSFKITIGTSENTKDRFYLHVSTSSALSLDNSSLDGIQIYAANKILFIKGVKEKASIEIFNILGQSVYKTSLSKDQNINLPLSVKQGVYNVKLSISDKMKTKMIVIN